jgi:hypothetical protein
MEENQVFIDSIPLYVDLIHNHIDFILDMMVTDFV